LSKDEQALAVPLAMRHEAALEPEMGGTDHTISGTCIVHIATVAIEEKRKYSRTHTVATRRH
jgi:hypothetical protein